MLNYIAEMRYKTKAILSGVTDIILINHNDELLCSPFNLRFGQFSQINPTEELHTIIFNLTTQVVKKTIKLIHLNLYVNEKLIHVPFILDDEFQAHFLYHTLEDINELRQRMKLQQSFEEQIQLPLGDQVLLFNIPTKNILKCMNLKYGINDIRYEIECKRLGKKSIKCQLYFLSSPLKIFISDIDGTITKSPALGLLITTLGQNYTQENICEFYTLLQKKGYVIIYSSARSMVQYENTKQFLNRQEQNGFQLPIGPIILSPQPLMDALTVEVIKKETDILKSKMLELFKQFAQDQIIIGGMGDRANDIVAYRNIGIQESRVLLINKKGEIFRKINNEDQIQKIDSIQSIIKIIDDIF